MADLEGSYHKVLSDGGDSQHVTSRRWFKVGATLLGGSCLVLFFIGATSVSFPTLHTANAAEPTSLFGVAKSMSLRTPAINAPRSASLQFLPGYNMNNQGNSYPQGLQPLGQNLPYQSRFQNLVPRGWFQGVGDAFFKQPDSMYNKNTYEPGEQAEFWSKSAGGWIKCTVEDVKQDGSVTLDVKPGYWLPAPEVKQKVRKQPGIFGYKVSAGKDLDLPARGEEDRKKQGSVNRRDFER
jgi:hypothetical protein